MDDMCVYKLIIRLLGNITTKRSPQFIRDVTVSYHWYKYMFTEIQYDFNLPPNKSSPWVSLRLLNDTLSARIFRTDIYDPTKSIHGIVKTSLCENLILPRNDRTWYMVRTVQTTQKNQCIPSRKIWEALSEINTPQTILAAVFLLKDFWETWNPTLMMELLDSMDQWNIDFRIIVMAIPPICLSRTFLSKNPGWKPPFKRIATVFHDWLSWFNDNDWRNNLETLYKSAWKVRGLSRHMMNPKPLWKDKHLSWCMIQSGPETILQCSDKSISDDIWNEYPHILLRQSCNWGVMPHKCGVDSVSSMIYSCQQDPMAIIRTPVLKFLSLETILTHSNQSFLPIINISKVRETLIPEYSERLWLMDLNRAPQEVPCFTRFCLFCQGNYDWVRIQALRRSTKDIGRKLIHNIMYRSMWETNEPSVYVRRLMKKDPIRICGQFFRKQKWCLTVLMTLDRLTTLDNINVENVLVNLKDIHTTVIRSTILLSVEIE